MSNMLIGLFMLEDLYIRQFDVGVLINCKMSISLV